MLDICEWADTRRFVSVWFGEGHSKPDGYNPSPLVTAAAVAGRTRNLRLRPLIVSPLYHPIRLAEDLAVLDLVSGGRLDPVFGAGRTPTQLELYGIERQTIGDTTDACIELCKKAWTGEPFEYQGRTIRITPPPFQSPRPRLIRAGMAAIGGRRAARVADGLAHGIGTSDAVKAYAEERRRQGIEVDPRPTDGPITLFVTDDPERTWPVVAPYVLQGINDYAAAPGGIGVAGESAYATAMRGLEDLRNSPFHQVLTPEACVAFIEAMGPRAVIILRPLFGGIDPDITWTSLELFGSEVLPRLDVTDELIDIGAAGTKL